jgi:hypothetical protein
VLRLKPRPVGLGLVGKGLDSTDDNVLDRGDAVEVDLGVKVSSGDLTSPASRNAVCSSAFVGSLIGDLGLVARGDEDVDCRPHIAVALFTEANVEFSGAGSSLTGVRSTSAGAIFFDGVGSGLSTMELDLLAGDVGSGRENRDCNGAGEVDEETGLDEWVDWCTTGFCGVLCDPDILLPESSELGFLGMFGDNACGDVTDSGWGDVCEMS